MTKIRIAKGEAKVKVGMFIGKLETMKGHVEGNSYQELEGAFAQLQNVDACVVGSLSRMFDDDVQASEYERLCSEQIDNNISWLDNQEALVAAIERRAAWLRNLCGTIDDMEQSVNPITVDGGCEKGAY